MRQTDGELGSGLPPSHHTRRAGPQHLRCAAMSAALALLAALATHAAAPCLVPHSKVEESFALQAVHDALAHGLRRPQHWDHVVFAGAVPRSFAPPLLLAGAVAVPVRVFGLAGEGAQVAGEWSVQMERGGRRWPRGWHPCCWMLQCGCQDVKALPYISNTTHHPALTRCPPVRVLLAVLYVLSLVPLQRTLAPGRSPRARQTRAAALLLHALSFAGVFWAGRTTPGNVVAPAGE
jgi:hypothetical protein